MDSEVAWIEDDASLRDLCRSLLNEPEYALDTEFHGEKSYYPRLALVQLAWPDGIALVDALAVDMTILRPLLEGDGTMVVHAGDQDLAILERVVGCGPSALFDTQI